MADVLQGCHPAVSCGYFALVIVCAMIFMHPACLLLSLVGAAWYVAQLKGSRALGKCAAWLVPTAVLTALINPAFTHQGVTILTYLPSGNPLTLESILYGLASAVMLSAVVLWFHCVTAVMTSDKLIYLFGRVIPSLSLLLSMTLRFVPQLLRRFRTVAQAQKHMGRSAENGSALRRVKEALRVFSIVVTWSLESAIITADSMRCRGYGLKGRTSFALYRFDERDKMVAAWLALCGIIILGGALAGGLSFQYYPALDMTAVTPLGVGLFAVYGLLCLTPVLLNGSQTCRQKGGVHRG